MTTSTPKAKVSLLDDSVEIPNRNAVEASSAKQVFGTVRTALALVQVSAPIPPPSPNSD